jgi:hypothetical protein
MADRHLSVGDALSKAMARAEELRWEPCWQWYGDQSKTYAYPRLLLGGWPDGS